VSELVRVPELDAYNERRRVPVSAAVRAQGLVFLSGLGPIDLTTGQIVEGSIREQTAASFDAVASVLATVGCTLADVVSCRVYVTNAGHYDAVNEVYSTYFGDAPPARTFVAVGSWFGGFDIELEVIAVDRSATPN